MSLSPKAASQIADLLIACVRAKLSGYEPETSYTPFHDRLLGRDRYALFSFLHSMNTTLGMSIWEQMAVILASEAGFETARQYRLLGNIDPITEELIHNIHHEIREGVVGTNALGETEAIRRSIISPVTPRRDPDSVVDLFVIINGEENYMDITSVKPNIKEFVALKIKLLRWIGLRLSQNIDANVSVRLAIPYNPYYPEPYERFTLRGLYDIQNGEILVGEDFWDFIAGTRVFNDLLQLFQDIGEFLRPEIDMRFREL